MTTSVSNPMALRSSVELGLVPTHLQFVGGLVPDDQGKLPRTETGRLLVVERTCQLQERSPVPVQAVQIPFFPGLADDEVAEMVEGLREAGMNVHFILMVGGADPMNPEDEDQVVAMLVDGLRAAERNGIRDVSSTSVEAWMQPDAVPRRGDDFERAVRQNVKVHARAVREAVGETSSVRHWHIEFLRQGEFQTFTNLKRIWQFVQAVNRELGRPMFKVLVDAAHCGDSDLPLEEQFALIDQIAEADEMGMFHASARTTRGCLSTDDGWIGALLTHCAGTGKLETVLVEVFHCEDPALEGLRQAIPGHGVDTRDGRTWDEVVIDGLTDVARRLNNLVARGCLPAASDSHS